jgi:hypothetical protein
MANLICTIVLGQKIVMVNVFTNSETKSVIRWKNDENAIEERINLAFHRRHLSS